MAVRYQNQNIIKQRIGRLFMMISLCYIALVARLVYLQAIEGDYYRNEATKSRSLHFSTGAQRGAILDRDGKPLAISIHSAVLVCDPTKVTDPSRTATLVGQLIGEQPSAILTALSPSQGEAGHKINRSVTLLSDLTPEVQENFEQAQHTKSVARDLEGLAIVDRPHRAYPSGSDAVHVVGFLIDDKPGQSHGMCGIEQTQDRLLRGRNGYLKSEVDSRRRPIPGTQQSQIAAEDGNDVRLTIDSTIQHIAATELTACCQKYKPVGATAIVLDPKTGDILALVNNPDFDPSKPRKFDKSLEPLRDRALSLYEPGSTMKIVTAAAALQEKVISPSTVFECRGKIKIGKQTINCVLHGPSEAHGHGTETIREIISHSCNVGAAEIGIKLGLDRMQKYLKSFGLLEPTGVGLPGDAAGRLGFGVDAKQGGKGKVARMAFGQSISVTPLSMTAAYAAIANHGLLMRPRLLQAIQDSTGKMIQSFPHQKGQQILSPEVAEDVRSCLEAVVTSGTGKNVANVPGYTVAGKTGTAQKVDHDTRQYSHEHYVASFIGFLPAHNPRAVVCVIVDSPHGSYYGAQVAAPVFQSIARQLMWYWKVDPDEPTSLNKKTNKTKKEPL